MTALRWGTEFPNRQDGGQPEEWERIAALGGACVKLRTWHPPSVVDRALSLWPDCLFILRNTTDGAFEDDPELVGIILGKTARLIYIPDSEPNHPRSGWRVTGPDAYAHALSANVAVLRTRYPGLEIAAPPMVVMHDDVAWLVALEPTFRALGLPYRSAHIYWQGAAWQDPNWGGRLDVLAACCPGQRWIVDELGDSSGSIDAGLRADRCLAVMQEVARGGKADALILFLAAGGTSEWAEYQMPAEQLARVNRTLIDTSTGGTMDPKLSMYVDWAKARIALGEDPRDTAAFVAHLKALGADYLRPHEHGLPFVEVVPKAP